MIITKQYLMDNRTEAGSWTRDQVTALGIDWPPSKGWQSRVLGLELTKEQRIQFEAKKSARKAKSGNLAKAAYSSVISRIKELTDRNLIHLINTVQKEQKRRKDGVS